MPIQFADRIAEVAFKNHFLGPETTAFAASEEAAYLRGKWRDRPFDPAGKYALRYLTRHREPEDQASLSY